jgi:Derlin-2/3
MNFLGILNFPAPWLPWVLLAFSTILGASPVVDLIGIFVGHVYYYLEDIVPRMPGRFRGKKLIFTPKILKYLMDGPQVYAPQFTVMAAFCQSNRPLMHEGYVSAWV